MAKKINPTPVVEETAGVNTEVKAAEVVTTEAVSTEVDDAETKQSHEAQLIPSGIFVAENGDSFEFAVNQFTFKGKVYTKAEALSDHTDVLEHLISVKSFILKKV
jgi:hypothetical protein